MTALLIASLLSVKFPGGNANEFATMLVEATKQNVVISQSEGKRFPAAEFETSDLDLMARGIRSQTGHAILPGTDLVITDNLLPRRMINGARRIRRAAAEAEVMAQTQGPSMAELTQQPVQVNFISLPPKALNNGKVTFRTEKSDALQVAGLSGLSKPIKAHWSFEQVPVFVWVSDMPEQDFAKWVARAVGARLVVGEKDYAFELDPVETRKRAIATINAETANRRGPESATETKSRNFRITAINSLSPAQITEALKSRNSEVRVILNSRSPLTRIAVQHVRELEQAQLAEQQQGGRRRNNLVGIMRRVDNSRPATLTMDAQFDVELEIPVLDGNGRPGGVVRI